jgi:serine/threonine protein kinase
MGYQLLTGQAPFEGETPLAVVLKHLTDAPPRPEVLFPEVHLSMARVALRAMEKSPADRHQTARAMRAALRDAMDWAEQDRLSTLPASTVRVPGIAPVEPPRATQRSSTPVSGPSTIPVESDVDGRKARSTSWSSTPS